MFLMPHGIHVDPEGNIWVTDVGRHQVLKFALNDTSKPILTIGQQNEPGKDKTHFCQPSDIAVLRSGDFYVSDGYCNSRIVKYSRDGKYLMEWYSNEEGQPGHFQIPHALALHEIANLICVADRENYRVQCFDLQGNYLHQSISGDYGPIYSVAFAKNNATALYALNGYNIVERETQFEKKVLIVNSKNGVVFGSVSIDQDKAKTPHNIKVSDDAMDIYIGNLNPPQVLRYSMNKVSSKFNSNKII